ncbi:MAG TPA: head GIN domain-containing protein [Mucilaginibacter sp.]
MKKIAFTIVAALLMAGTAINASAQSEESRPVSGYNGIASSGSFDVHVKIDGTESLKIKGSSEAIRDIETDVENGKLRIRFKDRHGNHNYGRIDVYVTAKSLSSVANAGSGSVKVDGTVTGSTVDIAVAGSGGVTATAKGGDLKANISGSGSVSLSGSANNTKINITGSGELDAKGFKTENVSANIAGSGGAFLEADKTVSANIIGSGSVVYTGSASITNSRTIGSGRVSKAN